MYYQLAEDWLVRSNERVSENELMRRYEVTRLRLLKVLQRATDDLWVERLPGRGWRFLSVMVSQQAYEEGYRFRMVIEPATLLEPTFRVDKAVLQELADQQISLLKGAFGNCLRPSCFHSILIFMRH